MTLYTGINGVVKELTGLRSGVGGAVKTNSQMYGGVSGTKKRIFPKYTNADMSYIDIKATSYSIYDENGNYKNGGTNYVEYPDWYDDAASSWHGAKCVFSHNNYNLSPRDYFWQAYSWGNTKTYLYGTAYIVFKDGTSIELIPFLKNTVTKPGLTVNSYNIPFQARAYGNGTWHYYYTIFGQSQNALYESFYLNNTGAASNGSKITADYFSNSQWAVMNNNHATGWSGSATGFGNYPGYNSGTINGVTLPIRLTSSISGLAAPTY